MGPFARWGSLARNTAFAAFGALACALAGGCGLSMHGVSVQTKIAPASGEDLAGSCIYDLLMFQPHLPQVGVLVIFDRSDSSSLFGDYDVQHFAEQHQLAMLFPHQCNAKSFPDLQWNAAAGPGRALFAALDDFAVQTGHPELAKDNLLVFGFSAAGMLTATLKNYAPNRILGAMEYADASEYALMSMVDVSPAAAAIPTLVMSNAQDDAAGTSQDLDYYERARAAGALWGFAVQNGVGHCCTLSTKPLILPWMSAVLQLRNAAPGSLALVSAGAGTITSFVCSPDGVVDALGAENCQFTNVALGGAPSGQNWQTAWLPSQSVAQEWLAWVSRKAGD